MQRSHLGKRPSHQAALLLLTVMASGAAWPADMSVREIAKLLLRSADTRISLAGRDLSFLDLSGLDFKASNLAGTKLLGSDLTHANMSRASMANVVLDRAIIVGTDFSEADLKGALIRLPHSITSAAFDKKSAPRFMDADLSEARIVARFDGADFRNAKLTNANFAPYGDATQNTMAQRSVLVACDFSGAVLRGADLTNAILRFANFENAILSNADLTGADLTSANLSGADLTGARIVDANLDGANLDGARGLSKEEGHTLQDAATNRH